MKRTDKIPISAISDAYGLTPEALRYYEEKGLLKPERAGGGARRFSLNDVQRIGFIKSYQRQGFSLDEIKLILTGCSQDNLVRMMDEKRAQLREQLNLTRSIYNRMTACTDLLRDNQRINQKPRLCEGTAAYTLDFESTAELFESVPQNPVLRDLIDALPLTTYCSIIPLKRLEGDTSMPIRIGVCAPVEYAASIHADFSAMRMCAGPRTVRCLFELFDAKNNAIGLEDILTRCLHYMKENDLSPICDGYTRQYVWFADERGQRQHYAELILPVKG